jgi:hypothetical protein
MGKRDEFWEQVPEGRDGQIRWPEDPDERAALVRGVFGAKVIGALESVLADQLAVVDGVPPEPSPDYQKEVARRRLFETMSDEQRMEIRRLLRKASFGALYWILVKLEHFPAGDVNFVVEPGTGIVAYPQVGIEQGELHHSYFEWIERFSELGDDVSDAAQPGVAAAGAAPRS